MSLFNDRPLYSLTVKEFIELQNSIVLSQKNNETARVTTQSNGEDLEYSLRGAAKRVGVSFVTFQKWKNANLFSYTQIGRKCIFDIPLIMKELAELKINKKTAKK